MGKPALRIGDLTAHGGTVTVGKPTVMIGKMPASTLGDMHVCPMTTGPVPHVGGPATLGSTGVLLSKMPGARVSDMHVCVGPPSMGAMGCMTVLLGEAGSGGDAGNAATASAAASASKQGPKAIKPFDPIEPPSPATELHFVEVQVVDSAGLPLGNIRYKLKDPDGADIVGSASPEGRIRHDGYARAGSFKIEFPGVENARWPSARCKPNEALALKADAPGFPDGAPAMVVVFEERDNGRFQRQLARIPSRVSGGKVEASFTLLKEHYPLPFDPAKAEAFEESPEGKVEYFFFVEVEGLIGLSDKAQFREDARIEVLGADGRPMAGREYQVRLIDGAVRKGMLDKDGKATEKDIPVGPYSLNLMGMEAARPQPRDRRAASRRGAGARIASLLVLGFNLALSTACADEPGKPAKGGHPTAKEKPMTASAPAKVAFAPLKTSRYVQTGNQTDEGRLPDDFGTPPQLFWIRSEAGFARFGYERQNPPSGAAKPAPAASGELDFARHDVLLLTMGVQGTTGFALELSGIRKTGHDVRFLLKAKTPGPRDVVGEALTHPGVLVQVDKLPRDSRLAMEINGEEPSFQLRILE